MLSIYITWLLLEYGKVISVFKNTIFPTHSLKIGKVKKNTHTKKGWWVAQMIKHLSSKCKALTSSPSIKKKKKNPERKKEKETTCSLGNWAHPRE
jgi:hypothetical protein